MEENNFDTMAFEGVVGRGKLGRRRMGNLVEERSKWFV